MGSLKIEIAKDERRNKELIRSQKNKGEVSQILLSYNRICVRVDYVLDDSIRSSMDTESCLVF